MDIAKKYHFSFAMSIGVKSVEGTAQTFRLGSLERGFSPWVILSTPTH